MVKIDFEIERDGYMFKDALHLPEDHTFTDADIEAMKQQRFENWYTFVTTPTEEIIPEEVTVEEPVQE